MGAVRAQWVCQAPPVDSSGLANTHWALK